MTKRTKGIIKKAVMMGIFYALGLGVFDYLYGDYTSFWFYIPQAMFFSVFCIFLIDYQLSQKVKMKN